MSKTKLAISALWFLALGLVILIGAVAGGVRHAFWVGRMAYNKFHDWMDTP